MSFEETALIELMKLVKFRSREDYRHNRPFDLKKAQEELIEIRKLMTHILPDDQNIDIEERYLGGIKSYHIQLPSNPKRVIFYLHGGGYIFERTNHTREMALSIACEANIYIPEYRLAPDHPHPSALEDAEKAYLGLLESGVESRHIFVMGDSAGGGLALGLLLKLRDDNKPLPKAAVVMSPWADLSLSGESIIINEDSDPILSGPVLKEVAELILNGKSALDPYISPVYGNYENIPPLAIFVGEREILYDDSMRVAQRAEEADVDVMLDIGHGMVHVYPLFDRIFPEAKNAIKRIADFIHRNHI